MLLSYAVLGKANYEEVRKTASNVAMGFLGPIFLRPSDWSSTLPVFATGRWPSPFSLQRFSERFSAVIWGAGWPDWTAASAGLLALV
jgi:hypothetical protein